MAGRRPVSVEQRFWEKVRKTSGCWEWTANKNNKGYGMFYWVKYDRKVLAHRASWELHGLKLPRSGKELIHSCDNPGCVNPKHLSVATHRANMLDKHAKGRAYPAGWLENVQAKSILSRKLTIEQAEEANQMLNAGHSMRSVARHFQCDRDAIRCWLQP